MRTDVVIVGGGVVGLATAYFLARRGVDVTVVDDGGRSQSASAGNAGLVALGHPPLPRPGLVLQTLKWMLDGKSPLYVPLRRLDPQLIAWMWAFRGACREDSFRRSVGLMAELGRPAGDCIAELIREEAMDCNYQPRGWMDVFRTPQGRDHARTDAELLTDAGFDVTELDDGAVHEREPALGPSVCGAMLHRDSASLHPGLFLEQLATAAQAHGAQLRDDGVVRLVRDGDRIVAVETGEQRLEPDRVVLSAGAWSTALAATVGVRVPMQAGKGYHVQIEGLEPALITACVMNERHVAATPMGSTLRLAGTVELSGVNLDLVTRRVQMLTEAVEPYLPATAGRPAGPGWCGLRPCTADGLPVVGWAPGVGNLFVATGHAKMGLTLGPVTGRLVAEWLVEGRPSLDLTDLSPGRFA